MKIIGILGGMSPASTQIYYQQLCQLAQERLGGQHSPELLIRSVDFAPIEALQQLEDWSTMGQRLNLEAKRLVAGGAQLLLLATNTMHKVAHAVMQDIDIPLLHIAKATSDAITQAGLKRPGLMATAFTMEQNFYCDQLREAGLDPVIPRAGDRSDTHRIIYQELCRGLVNETSRQRYEQIAERLVAEGADSLILGCTEIGMLLHQGNVSVPVFDTGQIHCQAAIDASID